MFHEITIWVKWCGNWGLEDLELKPRPGGVTCDIYSIIKEHYYTKLHKPPTCKLHQHWVTVYSNNLEVPQLLQLFRPLFCTFVDRINLGLFINV